MRIHSLVPSIDSHWHVDPCALRLWQVPVPHAWATRLCVHATREEKPRAPMCLPCAGLAAEVSTHASHAHNKR